MEEREHEEHVTGNDHREYLTETYWGPGYDQFMGADYWEASDGQGGGLMQSVVSGKRLRDAASCKPVIEESWGRKRQGPGESQSREWPSQQHEGLFSNYG